MFITKNGYGDLVVMSIETYERQLAIVDVYQKPLISTECTLQRRSSQLYRKRNLSGGEFSETEIPDVLAHVLNVRLP